MMTTEQFLNKFEQLALIKADIEATKTSAANLSEELNKALTDKEIYENSYNAFFDGIKYVNSKDTAIAITTPMQVKANLWYSYEGKTYVGIGDGILEAGNFEELLTIWED